MVSTGGQAQAQKFLKLILRHACHDRWLIPLMQYTMIYCLATPGGIDLAETFKLCDLPFSEVAWLAEVKPLAIGQLNGKDVFLSISMLTHTKMIRDSLFD